MAEMVISLAIAVTAIACISQLMALTASQNRRLEHNTIAVREAGNIMEDLMSRPWSELKPDNPSAAQLSKSCDEALPDAHLGIAITDDKTLSGIRQITIQIDWVTAGSQRGTPVRLVAWRAQNHEEAQP